MPVREQKPFPSLQVDLKNNVSKKFFTKIPKIPEERTIIEVAGKKYSKEELEETLRSSYEKIEMISKILKQQEQAVQDKIQSLTWKENRIKKKKEWLLKAISDENASLRYSV